MITITIPDWVFYLCVIFFLVQWLLNMLIAIYKRRCAISWDRLSEMDKKILGKLRPFNV